MLLLWTSFVLLPFYCSISAFGALFHIHLFVMKLHKSWQIDKTGIARLRTTEFPAHSIIMRMPHTHHHTIIWLQLDATLFKLSMLLICGKLRHMHVRSRLLGFCRNSLQMQQYIPLFVAHALIHTGTPDCQEPIAQSGCQSLNHMTWTWSQLCFCTSLNPFPPGMVFTCNRQQQPVVTYFTLAHLALHQDASLNRFCFQTPSLERLVLWSVVAQFGVQGHRGPRVPPFSDRSHGSEVQSPRRDLKASIWKYVR